MIIDAVLPAGGRIPPEFAREAGAEVKALIAIDGVTVLERVLAAVRGSGRIRHAVLVGPPDVHSHPAAGLADGYVDEGTSGPDNVFRGLDWLRTRADGDPPDRVLVLTTDLPFVAPETLCRYLDLCPPDAALALPAITRQQFEERFPGSANTFVPLADGQWTIGGAFLVDPAALSECRGHIDDVFAARKSQVRMAMLLGLPFILRYLTHRLTVLHIEQRCTGILGCSGAAVRGAPPELAFDIDEPVEFRYAAAHLAKAGATQ